MQVNQIENKERLQANPISYVDQTKDDTLVINSAYSENKKSSISRLQSKDSRIDKLIRELNKLLIINRIP